MFTNGINHINEKAINPGTTCLVTAIRMILSPDTNANVKILNQRMKNDTGTKTATI